jgi:hypothetical protein
VRKVIGHQHRAEDFFGGHGGGRVHVGQQRRRKEAAARRQRARRLEAARAFAHAGRHQRAHALQLRGVDQAAHVDRLVHRRAHAQALHAALEALDEVGRNAFLQQQPRAGAAHLALVEPDGVDHAFDRGVDVRVVEHDEGRFAAEFERERLARAGGGFANEAAHVGRAGEGDLVDAFVRDQCRARGAVTRHHVQHARGQAGLRGQLGEEQGAERRELGGLQHHRVAQRECGRDLPREHQQRKVPRNDLADDTQRHLVGELALLQLRPAGVVIEVARHQRHVEVARLADRLAVVQRLDHREQARMALHHAGQRVQMACAAMAAECEPAGLRGACRSHRRIHVLRVALRDAGQALAGGRLGGLEKCAGRRGGEAPVDEVAEALGMAREPLARIGVALWRGAVVHGVEIACDVAVVLAAAHRVIRSGGG